MINKDNRKEYPIYSGLLSYFPNAIREVSNVSYVGNKKHNETYKLQWSKEKSNDHEDAMLRHLLDHKDNPVDDDGTFHLSKVAWRALAALEIYLENKK